ncbi:MAG: hypothetical protein NTY34_01880 [Candidatus Omnitrophica bacterium]|nr:hypothetical protein [Candidatus Omnitrophota bacterium]
MQKMNKIISAVVSVAFLLNTVAADLVLGQELFARPKSDNLAAPLISDDIVGIEHKDIGIIKIALEAQLKLSETPRFKRAVKENTIFNPSNIQFFFCEPKQVAGYTCIKVRIKDPSGVTPRTYYALYKMQNDAQGGFPIRVLTEKQYKGLEASGALSNEKSLPAMKEADTKAINRYIEQNEKIIDRWIADHMSDPDNYIEIKPGSNLAGNFWFAVSRGTPFYEIDSAFRYKISDLLKPQRIVLVKVRKGESRPVITENGQRIEVNEHTSNNGIYIFVDEEAHPLPIAGKNLFNMFREYLNWVERPGEEGAIRTQRAADILDAVSETRSAIDSSLSHAIGVLCGLPWQVENGSIVNDMDRLFKTACADPSYVLDPTYFTNMPLMKGLLPKISAAAVNLDHLRGEKGEYDRDYASGKNTQDAQGNPRGYLSDAEWKELLKGITSPLKTWGKAKYQDQFEHANTTVQIKWSRSINTIIQELTSNESRKITREELQTILAYSIFPREFNRFAPEFMNSPLEDFHFQLNPESGQVIRLAKAVANTLERQPELRVQLADIFSAIRVIIHEERRWLCNGTPASLLYWSDNSYNLFVNTIALQNYIKPDPVSRTQLKGQKRLEVLKIFAETLGKTTENLFNAGKNYIVYRLGENHYQIYEGAANVGGNLVMRGSKWCWEALAGGRLTPKSRKAPDRSTGGPEAELASLMGERDDLIAAAKRLIKIDPKIDIVRQLYDGPELAQDLASALAEIEREIEDLSMLIGSGSGAKSKGIKPETFKGIRTAISRRLTTTSASSAYEFVSAHLDLQDLRSRVAISSDASDAGIWSVLSYWCGYSAGIDETWHKLRELGLETEAIILCFKQLRDSIRSASRTRPGSSTELGIALGESKGAKDAVFDKEPLSGRADLSTDADNESEAPAAQAPLRGKDGKYAKQPGKSSEDALKLIALYMTHPDQIITPTAVLLLYIAYWQDLHFLPPAENRESALRTMERDINGLIDLGYLASIVGTPNFFLLTAEGKAAVAEIADAGEAETTKAAAALAASGPEGISRELRKIAEASLLDLKNWNPEIAYYKNTRNNTDIAIISVGQPEGVRVDFKLSHSHQESKEPFGIAVEISHADLGGQVVTWQENRVADADKFIQAVADVIQTVKDKLLIQRQRAKVLLAAAQPAAPAPLAPSGLGYGASAAPETAANLKSITSIVISTKFAKDYALHAFVACLRDMNFDECARLLLGIYTDWDEAQSAADKWSGDEFDRRKASDLKSRLDFVKQFLYTTRDGVSLLRSGSLAGLPQTVARFFAQAATPAAAAADTTLPELAGKLSDIERRLETLRVEESEDRYALEAEAALLRGQIAKLEAASAAPAPVSDNGTFGTAPHLYIGTEQGPDGVPSTVTIGAENRIPPFDAGLTQGRPAPGPVVLGDMAKIEMERHAERVAQDEITAAIQLAGEAGMKIPTMPNERYNLLVTSEFFIKGELKESQLTYGDRFNLDSVSGRDADEFIRNVLLSPIAVNDRTIVLLPNELPNGKFEEKHLKALKDAGIRFMVVNRNELLYAGKGMLTADEGYRKQFQQDTYAIMLLMRAIDESADRSSPIYRLLSFYLNSHFLFADKIDIDDYIMAIAKNEIGKLIQGILAYVPAHAYDKPDYKKIAATLIAA